MMSTTKKSPSDRSGGGQTASLQTGSPLVEVVNRQRMHPIDRQATALLSQAVLDAIGESGSSLNIAFIRDRRMRELNRDYRGIDRPTDVLSFVCDEDQGAAGDGRFLGDMAISVETAARYAEKYGITLEREIEHLVIHGTLHLAGYDHETDNGEMNRLEKRLRKRLLPGGPASSTRL